MLRELLYAGRTCYYMTEDTRYVSGLKFAVACGVVSLTPNESILAHLINCCRVITLVAFVACGLTRKKLAPVMWPMYNNRGVT